VLRVGPNHLDIQSAELTLEAWGGHNPTGKPWKKDPELVKMMRGGMPVDNIASVVEFRDAMRFRRLMGGPFTKKFIRDQEHLIRVCVQRMMDRLEKLRVENNGVVEVFDEFTEYAFDALSTFLGKVG
jgi:cytochrome P450